MPKQPFTQIYDLDYFSGSQCFLYIGDVWVDEITSLSYQITQQKTPLYGYASQLFDDVAPGRVIVQGSFSVNFKESGYLWAVLRRYHNIGLDRASVSLEHIQDKKKVAQIAKYERQLLNSPDGKASRPVKQSNGTIVERASIERIVQGDVTRQERLDFYNHLSGYSTFNVKSPKDKQFEDIVEAFEDQIWVKPDNNVLNSQIRRTDNNVFDNFDMYVMFGNYDNPQSNHTVQKIIGVHLIGNVKQIVSDGMPIQEHYQFLAQSVV